MIKRIFDFILSLLSFFLLFPILIVLGLWVRLDSKGPIFFRQERVGYKGKIFRIHKFRTMIIDAEKSGRITVGRDSRITECGYFLRKYKLDELPQLIDVLIGNMSFVGPRPEVQEFIDEYPVHVREKVLSVRPGITDLASIEMVDENNLLSKYSEPRNAYIEVILPIKQKYYMEYVDSHSFFLDLKIIVLTLKKILSR